MVSPGDRRGLHPLLIPLASAAQQQGSGSGQAGAGELTCLLRWPEGHQGMELPVVAQARGGTQVCGACGAGCLVGKAGGSGGSGLLLAAHHRACPACYNRPWLPVAGPTASYRQRLSAPLPWT